jgi:hypothetical protein
MRALTHRVQPDWRDFLWLALLVATSVAFTLAFACAVPLAAFASLAALTLNRRDALLLAGGIWFANQCVGFGMLDYPWTVETLAWGIVLGVVALLSVLAAEWPVRHFTGTTACGLAFLAAFAAYEGSLFAVSLSVHNGTEAFTPTVIGRVFAINAVAFVGLFAVDRLGIMAGLAKRPAPRFIMTERHA